MKMKVFRKRFKQKGFPAGPIPFIGQAARRGKRNERGDEDIFDRAVYPRHKEGGGAVRIGVGDHPHPGQPREDVDDVGKPGDLFDLRAEGIPEDQHEEDRHDHRRRDRLGRETGETVIFAFDEG